MSSNTKNQVVVQDGRVDIQTKNEGYGGNANKNAGRNINQMFNAGNGSDESNQIIQRVPRTDSTPSKYFREQMLLAMKDEAGSHLSNEENDFMLDNAYGEESLDELTASVMLMARLQPANGNTDTMPSYDEKAVSQLAKKAFQERENRYLEDIVDLEEKLSSHDRINPERLKKAIAAQPKMYDGDMLHSDKLIIDSPDSEETLENA
ncbi:hypothetical protein Tco_0770109 [Tanacetum coccineum]|uniref:Uncharacterized protein n=1 Tax=Tanacetum coccineum TaxID=301880 RepID=A0ABQ4ZF50_9ASTR